MTSRVLVVEDEPTLRDTLAESLRDDGLAVDTAADGASALDRFRMLPPDLVLLDLVLPELSGTEVCRIIRAESAVPILMLTARSGEADMLLGLELGADDYVTKPFSLRELQARVRALLRRSGTKALAPSDRWVGLGEDRLDVAGRQLLRRGVSIALTPRTFDLLAYLVAHIGRVVSRDELLDQVWGLDYPGGTRTVDVHVHALRQALEDSPGEPRLLQTVRGVGYVLRSEPRRR